MADIHHTGDNLMFVDVEHPLSAAMRDAGLERDTDFPVRSLKPTKETGPKIRDLPGRGARRQRADLSLPSAARDRHGAWNG